MYLLGIRGVAEVLHTWPCSLALPYTRACKREYKREKMERAGAGKNYHVIVDTTTSSMIDVEKGVVSTIIYRALSVFLPFLSWIIFLRACVGESLETKLYTHQQDLLYM